MKFSLLVIDTNDRFLRKITIGQSATEKNFTRQVLIFILVFNIILFVTLTCMVRVQTGHGKPWKTKIIFHAWKVMEFEHGS